MEDPRDDFDPTDHAECFRNAAVVAENVKQEDYRRQSKPRGHPEYVMTRTDLVQVLKNPLRWLRGYEQDKTDSLEWGDMCDCLVLTPQFWDDYFIVSPEKYPDEKTGELKDWIGTATYCKKWKKENAHGRKVVSFKEKTELDQMVVTLKADPEAGEFVRCSRKAVLVVAEYVDEATGLIVPVKLLLDLVPPHDHPKFGTSLGDYKTSKDGDVFPWTRSLHSYGYRTQAAFYTDAWTAANPDQLRNRFRHVIQENVFPWMVCRRMLSDDDIKIGRKTYLAALKAYAQCLATKQWDDYEQVKPGRLVLEGWTVTQPEPWMYDER